MAYGFDDDKSKVEVYSKMEVDNKLGVVSLTESGRSFAANTTLVTNLRVDDVLPEGAVIIGYPKIYLSHGELLINSISHGSPSPPSPFTDRHYVTLHAHNPTSGALTADIKIDVAYAITGNS